MAPRLGVLRDRSMKTINMYSLHRWQRRRKRLDCFQIDSILCHFCRRFVSKFKYRSWLFCTCHSKWHYFGTVVAGNTKFRYFIPGLGPVCRTAWLLTAGFGARNNRVEKFETKIRRGTVYLPKPQTKKQVGSRTLYAEAFLNEYILHNSQRSPVTNDL